ncbi:GNAT family N-acetyltransferase [Flavobacterium flavipallidum]|uniref:Acetyltransferase (GNAT) family protein n=1 Tax=Flavobacterium flavipallidum TaxID=3139140 RepID=A0ABU9HNP8_9FLAO
MELNLKQQQLLNFRAVTISDLNAVTSLYQQHNTAISNTNFKFNHHFGLPLYVAEWNNEIVGYSYVVLVNPNDYCLKTNIATAYSNEPINKNLMLKTEYFFKKEWQHVSSKNLTIAIDQLVKWLNNSIS